MAMMPTDDADGNILPFAAPAPVQADCCEAVISIETMQGLIDDGMELIVRAPCPVMRLQLRGRVSGVPFATAVSGR